MRFNFEKKEENMKKKNVTQRLPILNASNGCYKKRDTAQSDE